MRRRPSPTSAMRLPTPASPPRSSRHRSRSKTPTTPGRPCNEHSYDPRRPRPPNSGDRTPVLVRHPTLVPLRSPAAPMAARRAQDQPAPSCQPRYVAPIRFPLPRPQPRQPQSSSPFAVRLPSLSSSRTGARMDRRPSGLPSLPSRIVRSAERQMADVGAWHNHAERRVAKSDRKQAARTCPSHGCPEDYDRLSSDYVRCHQSLNRSCGQDSANIIVQPCFTCRDHRCTQGQCTCQDYNRPSRYRHRLCLPFPSFYLAPRQNTPRHAMAQPVPKAIPAGGSNSTSMTLPKKQIEQPRSSSH